MSEITFRVNRTLALMAELLHTVGSAFIEQSRTSHVTATVLGLRPDGTTEFIHLRCPGEDIDAEREALFAQALGSRFGAMVFFCEAWNIRRSSDEPEPVDPSREPGRLEVVVFDGRDARGNQLRARALINREEGAGLMPLEYMMPDNFRYRSSITEHTE